jgi:N-acetylneuraminic acid mutarotase
MAKKKKQNVEKKLALAAKKEAKQEKAARKRITKQQKKSSDHSEDVDASASEPIDKVIQTYRSHDKKVSGIDKPTVEDLDTEFPLPRANATFEYGTDDKSKGKDHLYLFGGEYFDGVENIVLDALLRYDIQKKEWKQILTVAPRPSPRCAHSCISYRSCLYVFGGELANSDQYHHYRDLWKFDLRTLTWSEIKARNPPSARSGMGCLVWKHYMVIFGGFFEAVRETKWYNDVHVFDLQTETWMDVPQSRLAIKPEPRSACNVALYGTDKMVVHGGFSKFKASTSVVETKTHTDAWVLHLSPLLQQKPPTWERWMSSSNSKSANTPNGRAGMSSLSYKNRMLVFGGVVDREEHHHKVESVFYNDLMVMDIERRKWFPLRVNKAGSNGSGGKKSRRRRKDNDGDDGEEEEETKMEVTEDSSSISELEEDIIEEENDEIQNNNGWDINMLRSNMFAFVDGDGNIVYEKIEDDEEEEKTTIENEDGEQKSESEENEEEKEETKEEDEETKNEESIDDDSRKQPSNNGKHGPKKITSSSVMAMNETKNAPEAVHREDPLPRINAATLVHGNTMYLLGGILEVGDREVTLDDMWTMDLRKRDQWECVWQGTMYKQVWRGAEHDDDESYISTGLDDGNMDEDDDSGSSDDDDEDRKMSKESRRSSIRQEVTELNQKYDLGDNNRTPENGESLADFYSRTSDYWNGQATEQFSGVDSEPLTHKELKRQGFILAKERYEDLAPILERLVDLGIGGGDDKGNLKDSKKKEKKDKKEKKKKKSSKI